MQIAIVYICTGKYDVFWKDFYSSCELNFLPNVSKKYIVYTDAAGIEYEHAPNVQRVYQKDLGWPGNTLDRYSIFLKDTSLFKDSDYTFFFNANLLFLQPITSKEFLPSEHQSFVACLHPGYYSKDQRHFTYERNSRSTAFINMGDGTHYFAGGINGGKTADFVRAMEKMDKNIKKDFDNHMTAVWHDESHWNLFINTHLRETKILTPSYLYPEGMCLPFDPKILVRDKKLLGGHRRLRGDVSLRLYVNSVKRVVKECMLKMKRRKVVYIKGGLGNQLFQYAHGRSLELSGKQVIFDVTFFEKHKIKLNTARDFRLDKFNLKTLGTFKVKTFPLGMFFAMLKKVFGMKIEQYWQSEKSFKDIEEILREEFILKGEISSHAKEVLGKIKNSNSVSMHIRRGDYIRDEKTYAFHGVCNMDYYQKSIDLMNYSVDDSVYFIFSDDIQWAKENFVGNQFIFVSCSQIEDYEELILMSTCKHNIIANSSFSWWGAWLNSNKNKIVIAPKKWFNNARLNDESDIVPKNWIRL